ncbi:MAG: DUF2029 domain-containing protein, partial [Candidatus Dormibacteraeota bacterium]|nr:DUF2029 domain-containing protein [Candidatus Dormibacteraeota bacterium]
MRARIRRWVFDDPWMLWSLLAVLVLFRLFAIARGFGEAGSQEDIDRFWAIAGAPGRPYVTYQVEYPPLTLALFKALASFLHTQTAFGTALIVISALAEAGMAVLVWRTWGREAALAFLVLDSVLYVLVVTRLDFVSTALALAALAACIKRRPALAGLLIVAAAGVKLWPLALAPLLFVLLSSRDRRRYLVALLAGGVCLLAGWLAVGGIAGIQQVLTFRGATGWQVESAIGSVVHLVTREAPFLNRGTHRFGSVPPGLPEALLAIAALVSLWVARSASPARAG